MVYNVRMKQTMHAISTAAGKLGVTESANSLQDVTGFVLCVRGVSETAVFKQLSKENKYIVVYHVSRTHL